MNKQIITFTSEDKVRRLDMFLLEKMSITRSQAQKMIKNGELEVNGEKVKKTGYKLSVSDKIEIVPAEIKINLKNKDNNNKDIFKKIKIIDDQKDFLVINKPSGILVHPTLAKEKNTLTDWLLENYPETEGVGEYDNRPGIVHRLDKETSGLLVIAKNQKMFLHLKKQFQNREVEKYYMTLVHGKIDSEHFVIDFAIDRGSDGRMASRPKISKLSLKTVDKIQPGKVALTEIWKQKEYINYTLLNIKLHTGRTNQIRVHLFAYGHPIVADRLYFSRKHKMDLDRLFLHSYKLSFSDLSGETKSYEIKLPVELKRFLDKLK